MKRSEDQQAGVRVELVTASFVAAGAPDGVHDLGRFLEVLNNPALGQQLELREPSVRSLYDATLHVELDAPLLVQRRDIIFATFDGPAYRRGAAVAETAALPVLLMSPPFQITGSVELPHEVDPTAALRSSMPQFFAIKFARVFDTEGVQLGEGEHIIVNGDAVQLRSATRRHIEAAAPAVAPAVAAPAATAPVVRQRAAETIGDDEEDRSTRAA